LVGLGYQGFYYLLTRKDRELEIVQELQDAVIRYDKAMIEACDVCAELDCLLCFAEASKLNEYRRPEMNESNAIVIQQGRYMFLPSYRLMIEHFRHPLHEQIVDTFVPNDVALVGGAGIGGLPDVREAEDSAMTRLGFPKNSLLVCTGANACGKVRQTIKKICV
jgi:DNA mismatch repair protein MSH5